MICSTNLDKLQTPCCHKNNKKMQPANNNEPTIAVAVTVAVACCITLACCCVCLVCCSHVRPHRFPFVIFILLVLRPCHPHPPSRSRCPKHTQNCVHNNHVRNIRDKRKRGREGTGGEEKESRNIEKRNNIKKTTTRTM